MKIKDGFIVQEIAGNMVAAATGEAAKTFNGIVTLNETGEFLFKLMMNDDMSEKQLCDALLAEFDTDRQTAEKDTADFIKKLRDAEIFE